eukprot:2577670-Prymnesium_polylepis.2
MRATHLEPPCTSIALHCGVLAGGAELLPIVLKRALQQLRSPPCGVVRAVPHVHLAVKLSVPRVAGQTRFGGRQGACLLHAGRPLRHDQPPLELRGAGVAAACKVDGAAAHPELLPRRRTCRHRLLK